MKYKCLENFVLYGILYYTRYIQVSVSVFVRVIVGDTIYVIMIILWYSNVVINRAKTNYRHIKMVTL